MGKALSFGNDGREEVLKGDGIHIGNIQEDVPREGETMSERFAASLPAEHP